ncbi:hypothetical protein LCGC14_2825000 [marine sediment metagenome]|uniref:Uncharacterized protein n=1 Tax=marine sediment metagenome TaxID=412755 RepID=A0A0F9AP83_9ZZZZ
MFEIICFGVLIIFMVWVMYIDEDISQSIREIEERLGNGNL